MISVRRCPLLLGVLVATGCTEPGPTAGDLILSITGLPAGAQAGVVMTGPNQFRVPVPGPRLFESLAPGEYTLDVETVRFSDALYSPTATRVTLVVTAGNVTKIEISYHLASGSIELSLSGVPEGVVPRVQLTGEGVSRTISGSSVIHELVPGEYTIRAEPIANTLGDRFEATTSEQSVVVTASTVPVQVSVSYVAVTGGLTVNVTGLPYNISSFGPDPVTITGPDNFEKHTAATVELHGLKPGTYTVTAKDALGPCPFIYIASPPQQTVTVSAGSMGIANVAYTQHVYPLPNIAPARTLTWNSAARGFRPGLWLTGSRFRSACASASQDAGAWSYAPLT